MKKILLFISILISLGLVSQKLATHTIQSLLKQVKISEDEAQNHLFSSISYPSSFYFPNLHLLKSISMGERQQVVPIVGKGVKDFTTSPEFMERYNEYREGKKPRQPEPPKSGNEIKEQQRQSIEQSITSMEELKKAMPDQKAALDESITSLKAQLKELDSPDNSMYENMDVILKQGYDQQIEEYNRNLVKWETEYPDNPTPMIRVWLTNFLNESSDVDFDAELADGPGGKKLFVKSAYEQKSGLWKLCYRAGKETVNAARSFAQTWLNELK